MSKSEEMMEQLGKMLAEQMARSEAERKEAIKREERMNELLQSALRKIPAEPMQPYQQVERTEKIPNNATPAPILTQNATLREFVTWKQKVEDFMLLTG